MDKCLAAIKKGKSSKMKDETNDQIVKVMEECCKNFDFLKEDSEGRKAWIEESDNFYYLIVKKVGVVK